MKKQFQGGSFIFMLCAVQFVCFALPGVLISETRRDKVIGKYADRYSVDMRNERNRGLLRGAAATSKDGRWILGHQNSDARMYSSNVLRAAKEIAKEIHGERSEVYRALERMLSHK